METLSQIFDKYRVNEEAGHADKGSIHSYIEPYEQLLATYRNGCTILEVGIAQGWSVKMWNDYFHNSRIIGNDISIVFDVNETKPVNNNTIEYIQHDATKQSFLETISNTTFDIIIDDGSHMEQDQFDTFNMLKHRMNKGGLYIIEDILALDMNKHKFLKLHPDCEIMDLRHVKKRFDDVLIIYRF